MVTINWLFQIDIFDFVKHAIQSKNSLMHRNSTTCANEINDLFMRNSESPFQQISRAY